MTQDRATPQGNGETGASRQQVMAGGYYGSLGLQPSASLREIRQAYRDLSKLCHPDTTALPSAIATVKFQQLNEAYATLSSPERRLAYDHKLGYVTAPAVAKSASPGQANGRANQPASARTVLSSSAYLDPTDRPLSPGEIFALFILGLTFVGCLVLAIAIGITRGEAVLQPSTAATGKPQQEMITVEAELPSQPPTSAINPPLADPVLPQETITVEAELPSQPPTSAINPPLADPVLPQETITVETEPLSQPPTPTLKPPLADPVLPQEMLTVETEPLHQPITPTLKPPLDDPVLPPSAATPPA